MKQSILTFLLAANVILFAQTTTENLTMGAGYTNDIYYSLKDGMIKTTPRTDWHIAFTTKIVDAAVVTNSAAGIKLFVGSTNISDWTSFDTTGMSWNPLYNSDLYWTEGAFNYGAAGHPDYGWGNYNSTTHIVNGNKIFVIEFPDTTYKKMVIDAMKTNGDFIFRIANIDGTGEVTKTFNKKDYTNANFFYYDAVADTAFSREPDNTTWDLLFTKYDAELSPGVWYSVTGALQNTTTKASIARGIDTAAANWNNYIATDSVKNIIGHDWKDFDLTNFVWVIEDSLSYFVESHDGNMYQVIFTDWKGASSGDFTFTTKIVSAIGIGENAMEELNIYPNPATDIIRFKSEENLSVEIYNYNGTLVLRNTVNLNGSLNISKLKAGTYIIKAEGKSKVFMGKILIL